MRYGNCTPRLIRSKGQNKRDRIKRGPLYMSIVSWASAAFASVHFEGTTKMEAEKYVKSFRDAAFHNAPDDFSIIIDQLKAKRNIKVSSNVFYIVCLFNRLLVDSAYWSGFMKANSNQASSRPWDVKIPTLNLLPLMFMSRIRLPSALCKKMLLRKTFSEISGEQRDHILNAYHTFASTKKHLRHSSHQWTNFRGDETSIRNGLWLDNGFPSILLLPPWGSTEGNFQQTLQQSQAQWQKDFLGCRFYFLLIGWREC